MSDPENKPNCEVCAKVIDNIVLTCHYCFGSYHPACKKVVGANIKKYNKQNFYCSELCETNYGRIVAGRAGDESGQTNRTTSSVSDLDDLKAFMAEKFRTMQETIDRGFNETQKLHKRVDQLSNKCVYLEKCVENLKYDVDAPKRQLIKNNITILGVPNHLCAELKDVVNKIGDVVSYSMDESVKKIDSYKNKKSNAVTIVVEFSNNEAKRKFLDQKKLKGDLLVSELGDSTGGSRSKRVFIRDELTRYGMSLYTELRAVRKFAKIKYCWTKDAEVFARIDDGSKIMCVKSSFDIHYLLQHAEKIPQTIPTTSHQ
jgi:hypothetical protein